MPIRPRVLHQGSVSILFFKRALFRFNVYFGETEEKEFVSGTYKTENLYCMGCSNLVGWKYVRLITEIQGEGL